jgi:hypothetical protein
VRGPVEGDDRVARPGQRRQGRPET